MDKFNEYIADEEQFSELTKKEQQELMGGWEPIIMILIEKVKDYFGLGEEKA